MCAARSANLTIRITVDNSGSRSWMEAPGGSLEVKGNLSTGALTEQKKRLDADLNQFRSKCQAASETVNWQLVLEAMQILHARGRRLAFQLYGTSDDIVSVERFWNEQVSRLHPSGEAPLIELIADEKALPPIELIPVFNFEEPAEITDLRSLEVAASAFPGFTCIVKRTVLSQDSSNERSAETRSQTRPQTIYCHPKLGMKFFYYAGLAKAEQEFRYLKARPEIDIEEPWPAQDTSQRSFAQQLCKHLWNREFSIGGEQRAAEIYHFTCHCYTIGTDSEDHFLQLAPVNQPGWKVTLGELQDGFLALARRVPAASKRELPLVFLNACGSSTIMPASVSSFPRFLMAEGFRGMIGTETRIPDDAAYSFARAFYDAFLARRSLGEALLSARHVLLARANPLGILYTMYADPDTTIAN